LVDYKYAAPTVLGAIAERVPFREASGVPRVHRRFRVDNTSIHLVATCAGESARGLAHSKTLRVFGSQRMARQHLGVRWPSTAFLWVA